MSKIIEPLRGVHDVLPAQVAAWQYLERITREVFAGYGYEEFRVPVIEQTQLFKRSIGDFTDIVEKEMFSFVDQGEDHITLRPEATAGIVRAVISNGMLRDGRLRVWCMGPMFRRERPQAGRFRQFHQIDAEAFGFEGPDVDAELILLSARLLRRLGLTQTKLLVNSLGTPASRAVYREQLSAYFSAHERALDEDSKRRLKGNPLRILDSKNPEMRPLIAAAPLAARFPGCGVAGALRRRCAPTCAAPASSIMSSRTWCADSTITPARYSSGPRTHWARRARFAPAAAMTAWWRNWAAPPPPGSAGPWVRNASSCCWRSRVWPSQRERPQMYLILAGERTEIAGVQTGGAIAQHLAGPRVANQSRRRQFQDAIQACRQERRAVGARPGG